MPETSVKTEDPFGSSAAEWRSVSARLATVRRISVLVPLGVIVVVGIGLVAVLVGRPWLVLLASVIGLGLLAWPYWLIGRQVRATRYALRADDLVVVSGIMFRRLVVVPYGRMQLVDVTRGPIDRHFGLASVQLHTAAATTDASVPGLTPAAASELRDQLASLGEQRSAGL